MALHDEAVKLSCVIQASERETLIILRDIISVWVNEREVER